VKKAEMAPVSYHHSKTGPVLVIHGGELKAWQKACLLLVTRSLSQVQDYC
jgi:hypothetical protein